VQLPPSKALTNNQHRTKRLNNTPRGIETSFTAVVADTTTWGVSITRNASELNPTLDPYGSGNPSGNIVVHFSVNSDASTDLNINDISAVLTIPASGDSPASNGQNWCNWDSFDCGDGNPSTIHPGVTDCTIVFYRCTPDPAVSNIMSLSVYTSDGELLGAPPVCRCVPAERLLLVLWKTKHALKTKTQQKP